MYSVRNDEWGVIERLLPEGWMGAAKETRAFLRARYLDSPARLLRILLFHAVNNTGMRETMAQIGASGIAELSQVALFKRLKTAGDWLAWLGAGLCRPLRDEPHLPNDLRPRVVDSTTIQGPASKGITWRLHYALDLRTLTCDWFEVTDVHGGEFLERTPLNSGDVVLADRNFLRPEGVRAAVQNHGDVLIRMRWTHPAMVTPEGNQFQAITHAGKLRAGKIGEWRVQLCDAHGAPIPGRVVAIRLPAPLAEAAKRRALRQAERAGRQADPCSLVAAQLVMLFTTLPESILKAEAVLELYRYRWQIELAFKRLKQLLRIGQLPHKDPAVARSWILAKLVVALLLETLFRNARAFSPWGYDIRNVKQASNQPLALDCRVHKRYTADTLPFTRNPRTTEGSRRN